MQVKKIDENQRRYIVEEVSSSIISFLENLVEEGKVRTYEFSVKLSDDWPYMLEIDISVSVNPFFEHEKAEIIEKALNIGLEKARKVLVKFGLHEF